ncbi:MAG: HAD family hydrolase [Treponema sp.]|nr:MAG: HAD family hydrolase [Treponema sp.]
MKRAYKKPEMIIFDYGHTLVYESSFDLYKGYEKLHGTASENPLELTPEQMHELANKQLFDKIYKAQDHYNTEYKWNLAMRAFFEANGLKFPEQYTEKPCELEILFWDAIAPGQPMPGISELLELLHKMNIRTGVISNISFSQNALTKRINSCIPNNKFEFIIASSEYNIRKPNQLLFQAALQKANLPAKNAWYCGDNIDADIHGSNACGIFPLWFNSPLKCAYHRSKDPQAKPLCEHLYITDWSEFYKFANEHFTE